MKKIITFLLVFVASLQFAFADLLPDIPFSEPTENIINIYDYPNWTFLYNFGYAKLEIVPDNGKIGCRQKEVEIRAFKKDSKTQTEFTKYDSSSWSITQALRKEKTDNFRQVLQENGAILLSSKFATPCYPTKETNYITINPEDLGLIGEFKISTTLSETKQESLKKLTEKSFERLENDVKTKPSELQQTLYETLISKIDETLKTENRKEIVYVFSYLQYLAKKALNK